MMEAKGIIDKVHSLASQGNEVIGTSGSFTVFIEQTGVRGRIAVQIDPIGRFLVDPREDRVLFKPGKEYGYRVVGDSVMSLGVDLEAVLDSFQKS